MSSVVVTLNSPTLPLGLFGDMMNKLNDAELWGQPTRCIKLSGVNWIRNLYGICTYYFTITYRFDVNTETFDRTYDNAGMKQVGPGGTPGNPAHWIPCVDSTGRPASVPIFLDAAGKQTTKALSTSLTFQYYATRNFLLLGIPADFYT